MDCRIFTHPSRSFQSRHICRILGNVPHYDSETKAIASLSSSQGKDFGSMFNQAHIHDLYPPESQSSLPLADI